MAKLPENIWQVMFESLKLYISNIHKFTLYMLFPVFGQLISICLIIASSVFIGNNVEIWALKFPIFDNFVFVLLLLLVITIPLTVVLLKAFWDYMVAYGALNSMSDALLNTGKLYDYKAHNQMVTNNLWKFILLLLLLSIFYLFAINPLFWIICVIFFVYFVLIFQVFIFEKDLNALEIFKKSFLLIKGNFAKTFTLLVFAGCFLYIVNYAFLFLFNITHISDVFVGMFESFALNLPVNEANSLLSVLNLRTITELDIAKELYSTTIFTIALGLTLPMRSVLWTLWYKYLNNKSLQQIKKQKTDKVKDNVHM